ncbi:ANTAR domain-containing protein [Streptomyces sp. NRRL F-525]|uniref:ANTAR domain-containing protein n=1 Tax=Streptomyces sp. NRRL F-525 TaxID=1463861 RepID=UPI0005260E75|nr:ANTAR domain-containing protein [Streptomyces sp. NRRL F-525]
MRHAPCTTHQPTTTLEDRSLHPLLAAVPSPPDPALLAELLQLRAQNSQLALALETRAVIDQARGMVMALAPCTGDRAWELLVGVSQHCNIKLRTVAAALVATAEDKPLPADIQRELRRALRRLHAADRP